MAKDIDDIYPLSPIQEGLMFEQLYRSGTGIYTEQLIIDFEGTLDTAVFERAWQAVVDRHPILRTSFHWQGDRALQVVHRTVRLPLEVLDWRDVGRPEQQRRLRAWLGAERIEGFVPNRAPLMRTSVLRCDESRWTFAWRFSHLLMDGWSFGLAMQEFANCYRALARRESLLWAPPPPYRDYVRWWADQESAKDIDFWRSELAGYVPPEPLSIDGAAIADGEATHDFCEVALSRLAPGLRTLARTQQLTLNTIVQGAWLLLLSRYLGTTDVVCGATIAHRPPDLTHGESILGPMIVTLPVRERLPPHRALLPWLADFQIHLAVIREHARLPLVEVQRLVGYTPEGPLLESSVSFENVPMPDMRLDDVGLTVTGLFYDGRPHFPITMVIMPGEEMPLRIVFDRRRFSAESAGRISDQLVAVLRQITEKPELTLSELDLGYGSSLGSEPVEADLLTGEAATLAESFSRQVAIRPAAVAIRCDREQLTYAELGRLSDAMGHRLRAAGARPGVRVGLCLQRSISLVVAMVATFKSGAAYVPLDPTHPRNRLTDAISDADIQVVVTSSDLADRLAKFDGTVILEDCEEGDGVPDGATAGATASGTSAERALAPSDPAYVLYTSGSTGRPKGVVVTHANVQSLLAAGRAQFDFGPDDVWTFTHSHTFDYSVWEIWGALANGAALVVVPHWTARSPGELHRLVLEEGVTILSLTPAVFEQLADAALEHPGPATGRLRHVFLGGDRLEPAILGRWAERFGMDDPAVHNLYGVTEATVVSTSHRITDLEASGRSRIPIGRALRNQRVVLVDPSGRRVPDGARGEICLVGPAVARGYLGGEGLTSQGFQTAFDDTATPTYRSGDIARRLPDGSIEFLGRCDTQVKVRGYRVELGEIEAVLREHPAVRSAIATQQGQQVVAYVVPAGERVPIAALRDHAAQRLPDYMVPVSLGWLDHVPTNASGKVDLSALPLPERAFLEGPGAAAFVAPRSESELRIAALLREVLDADRIGVHDRLADLGLHSLAAMRLATRLRRDYRIDLPLRTVLESPTLATLLSALTAAAPHGSADEAPSNVCRRAEVAVSAGEEGTWPA